MGRNRLVQPDIVRLALSDGDFLDIKRELNFGEQRHMLASQMKLVNGEYVRDLEKIGIALILAHVVGWSFVDAEGRPIPYAEATVASLEPETVSEMLAALNAHLEAEEARRAERSANPTSATPLRAAS